MAFLVHLRCTGNVRRLTTMAARLNLTWGPKLTNILLHGCTKLSDAANVAAAELERAQLAELVLLRERVQRKVRQLVGLRRELAQRRELADARSIIPWREDLPQARGRRRPPRLPSSRASARRLACLPTRGLRTVVRKVDGLQEGKG